jgi:hypothetical protein
VKMMEGEQAHLSMGNGGFLHGAAILKLLVLPWARRDRIVCADASFALVGALQELKLIGLDVIGVVKTATQHFPQFYLSHLEMTDQGNRRELKAKDENEETGEDLPCTLAFCWMDHRPYFITSASSLQPGRAYS